MIKVFCSDLIPEFSPFFSFLNRVNRDFQEHLRSSNYLLQRMWDLIAL